MKYEFSVGVAEDHKFAPDAFAHNIGREITVNFFDNPQKGVVEKAEVSEDGKRVKFTVDLGERQDSGVLVVNPKDFVTTNPDTPEYSKRAWEKLGKAGVQTKQDIVAIENDLHDQGIHSLTQEWIEKIMEAQNAVLREAMDRALGGGTCGVKLVRTPMWDIISCEPDQSVPYGEIHEFVKHDIPRHLKWRD